jgi:hypothetical protein
MIYLNSYEKKLVRKGMAQRLARIISDPTDQDKLASGNGGVAVVEVITPNVWFSVPSIFRLKLSGSGSVSLSIRDTDGVVTNNAFNYSLPADVGVKNFVTEAIIDVLVLSDVAATVKYLG